MSETKENNRKAKGEETPLKTEKGQTSRAVHRKRVKAETGRGGKKTARNVRMSNKTGMSSAKRRRTSVKDKEAKNSNATGKKTGGKGSKKFRPASKAKRIDVCLTVAICIMLTLGLWRVVAYAGFREKKQSVASESFRPNTTVDGVDVSEMSYTQAVDYWEEQVEPAYRSVAVTFDDGTSVTAAELGCSSDYRATIEQAWHNGRTGSLEERYAQLMSAGDETSDHSVTRRPYDDQKVREYVQALAAQTDREPENAGLESFDTSSYQFTFHESRPGARLNQEKLVQDIEAALENGGGNVTPEIVEIPPEASTEAVASEYGMICEARTDASSSNKNRQGNIQLALSILSGICIEPGETFSFNKAVGERTKARGFKEAPAYIRGTVQDQVGGGICQVSTTLFNAAVKADMTIKERHAHSMRVSYVDPGKDATVDWENKDLKFTNNTSEKVYICGYLTSNKTVRIGMFGRLLPNGESISVETKKSKSKDYSTQYQVNFLLPSGETKTIQSGKKGCTAETIKVRKDASGNEISRETLFKSTYSPTNEIIEYGP